MNFLDFYSFSHVNTVFENSDLISLHSIPSRIFMYVVFRFVSASCSHFASSSARFCFTCSICLSSTAISASSSASRFFLNNVNDSFCFRSSPICFCAWSISLFARFSSSLCFSAFRFLSCCACYSLSLHSVFVCSCSFNLLFSKLSRYSITFSNTHFLNE